MKHDKLGGEDGMMARRKFLMEKYCAEGWKPAPERGYKGNGDAGVPKEEKLCPIHNVPMTQKTSKKDGSKWFSHKTEDPRYSHKDGWCNGKEPKE
jgi:hypothetical protein